MERRASDRNTSFTAAAWALLVLLASLGCLRGFDVERLRDDRDDAPEPVDEVADADAETPDDGRRVDDGVDAPPDEPEAGDADADVDIGPEAADAGPDADADAPPGELGAEEVGPDAADTPDDEHGAGDEDAETDGGPEADAPPGELGAPDADADAPVDELEAEDVEPEADSPAEAEADAPTDYGVDISCAPDTCPDGMAYIPCGPFRMGSDEDIESPRHTVFLSAYCIDLTEATNASWQACVAGSGCTPPAYPNSRTRTPYYGNAAFDEYPVIYITWLQAGAYCAWAGRRLPTEAEWEKAARGGCEVVPPETCGTEDEPPFPWGTATISCDLAHYGPCSPDDTDGAFSHPAGASPYGVLNTAGNVWEWVSDWYFGGYLDMCPDPCVDPTGPASGPGRLLRGGAFWNENHPGDVSVSATSRNGPWNEETKNEDDIGVRCVRSLP